MPSLEEYALNGNKVQQGHWRRPPPIPTARVLVPMRSGEALQRCHSDAFLPSETLVDASMQVRRRVACSRAAVLPHKAVTQCQISCWMTPIPTGCSVAGATTGRSFPARESESSPLTTADVVAVRAGRMGTAAPSAVSYALSYAVLQAMRCSNVLYLSQSLVSPSPPMFSCCR